MSLPSRKDISEVGTEERRFYVTAPARVVIQLQAEAAARGTDAYRLGGSVIALWVEAGCPDAITPREGGI
ncbi:hypothetical protein ABS648_23265 [Pseudomonas solani]|uniref:CopG family transcriptional regulator n=1 Tax=Pseudomonas solani TaxID=2731552 RepID=A0AAU7XXU8_9PSED